jgi:hypothetical protein
MFRGNVTEAEIAMKLRTAAFWIALVTVTVAAALASAQAASPQYDPEKEHCETRCTLDHESCESDTSDAIDECQASCDESTCSRCQSMGDVTTLEQCNAQCDQCKSQCDASAEPRRQGCDDHQRECLGKCMGSD